jgi:hypothetical protein
MLKKSNKKDSACACCDCGEEMKKDFKKLGDDLMKMAKEAKVKFNKMDDKSKKKVVAGIAGAAALLAGAIGIGKMKKKK